MKTIKQTLLAVVVLLSGILATANVSAGGMRDCEQLGPKVSVAPGSAGAATRQSSFMQIAARCVDADSEAMPVAAAPNCWSGSNATGLNAHPNCPDTDTCTVAYLTDERIPLAFRKDECVSSDICPLAYLIDERIPLEFRKDACGHRATSGAAASVSASDNTNTRVCQPDVLQTTCILPE